MTRGRTVVTVGGAVVSDVAVEIPPVETASPTNAQTVAAVKVLCRVAIRVIRLRLGKLDGTD